MIFLVCHSAKQIHQFLTVLFCLLLFISVFSLFMREKQSYWHSEEAGVYCGAMREGKQCPEVQTGEKHVSGAAVWLQGS